MTVEEKEDMLKWDVLQSMVYTHSTPGDEDDMATILLNKWKAEGWDTSSLGRMAIIAKSPNWDDSRKTILICAHLDSPGFIVQKTSEDEHSGTVVTLGYPRMKKRQKTAEAIAKLNGQFVKAKLTAKGPAKEIQYTFNSDAALPRGTRLCFAPSFKITDECVNASFLDNRLGCFLLHELAAPLLEAGVNVILAATANEEFLGTGACVMAAAVKPDMAIVLDATYEEPGQNVKCGQGPVLTLTDKSVIVATKQWEALKTLCESWNLPIQMEIYNFSGTDAKAFPQIGHFCTVLPILVPTTGNHSPCEKAQLADVRSLFNLLLKMTESPNAMEVLECKWS